VFGAVQCVGAKQRFDVLCGCYAVLNKQAKVLLCVGAKQGCKAKVPSKGKVVRV
jgi:hypothetical protein